MAGDKITPSQAEEILTASAFIKDTMKSTGAKLKEEAAKVKRAKRKKRKRK